MNQEWLGSLFKEETVLLLVTFEPNEYIGKNFKKIRLNSKSENIYIRYPETKRGNMHAKFCIVSRLSVSFVSSRFVRKELLMNVTLLYTALLRYLYESCYSHC